MSSIFNELNEQKMTLEGEIISWFCKKNHIKRENLDKYHRYAIATTLKYAQEQVKNIAYEPVLTNPLCEKDIPTIKCQTFRKHYLCPDYCEHRKA